MREPLSRDEAVRQLEAWVLSPSLRRHSYCLEAVMRASASQYGGDSADAERWALAGLLHDADYERHPDDHPRIIVAWLRDRGEPEIAEAIAAHSIYWDVPSRSVMGLALLACDELSGFIVACSLTRPGGIRSLTTDSVHSKLKKASFASSVDRREIATGVEWLGTNLTSHIDFVIDVLRSEADVLHI